MTASQPYTEVDRQTGILKTNGDVNITFGPSVTAGMPYYIKINHHNSVETWSASPVTFGPVTDYLFTTSASQAFGDNMIETFDSHGWAIYNGDVNQDQAIDATDFLELDPFIQNGAGGYSPYDINGDAAIDATDFLLLDPNIQNGIGASTP